MWGPSGDPGRAFGSAAAKQMVFVAHHVTGVRLIPQEWLDGFRPSGFREATQREIAGWYEERDLQPPAGPGAAGILGVAGRPLPETPDAGSVPPA